MYEAITEGPPREGVKILNVALPDWAKKIDKGKLDMNSPTLCILGQLYNTYLEGISQLLIINEQGVDYGFVLCIIKGSPQNLKKLRDIWIKLIDERLQELSKK